MKFSYSQGRRPVQHGQFPNRRIPGWHECQAIGQYQLKRVPCRTSLLLLPYDTGMNKPLWGCQGKIFFFLKKIKNKRFLRFLKRNPNKKEPGKPDSPILLMLFGKFPLFEFAGENDPNDHDGHKSPFNDRVMFKESSHELFFCNHP